jgi:hypothetical protein
MLLATIEKCGRVAFVDAAPRSHAVEPHPNANSQSLPFLNQVVTARFRE